MRSRAGFFWCSLWLTLLLLLPLILVEWAFRPGSGRPSKNCGRPPPTKASCESRPGAQSVWRMLLVVQKEEPAFVLVRADGPAHSVTFCALRAAAGQRTGWHYHTGGMYAFGWGGAGRWTCSGATLSTGETAYRRCTTSAARPSCWWIAWATARRCG